MPDDIESQALYFFHRLLSMDRPAGSPQPGCVQPLNPGWGQMIEGAGQIPPARIYISRPAFLSGLQRVLLRRNEMDHGDLIGNIGVVLRQQIDIGRGNNNRIAQFFGADKPGQAIDDRRV